MIDLNTLIPATELLVFDAFDINDRGEIAGEAVLPNGDIHAVLLIPCGKGELGCDAAASNRTNATAIASMLANRTLRISSDHVAARGEMLAGWRARLSRRYPGLADHKNW